MKLLAFPGNPVIAFDYLPRGLDVPPAVSVIADEPFHSQTCALAVSLIRLNNDAKLAGTRVCW